MEIPKLSTDYEIIKIIPSKHDINDGSLEVKFSDEGFLPEVKWHKDIYNGYTIVSTEYKVQNLSGGMYMLEILRTPGQSIYDTVFLATYDTIYPGDYFPIYPGSYWIYDNADSISCLEEYSLIGLGHTYTGISQTHSYEPVSNYPVDSVYLPSIHVTSLDRDYLFYHYSIALGNVLMRFLPVVNEEEGFYLQQWPDGRYYDEFNSLKILKVDTSLYVKETLFEHVIVAEHFNMPGLIGDRESSYNYVTKILYFAEKIGLVKGEIYMPYSVDHVTYYDTITISLVDYFINHR